MMIPGSRTSLNFDHRWEENIRSAREREALQRRADWNRLLAGLALLFKSPVIPELPKDPADILPAEILVNPVAPVQEAADAANASET